MVLIKSFGRGLGLCVLFSGWSPIAAQMVVPLGLPAVSMRAQPDDGRLIDLGKSLFFDVRLSAEGSVSCASCHQPNHTLSDQRPVAIGRGQQSGTRNTPSLYNAVYATSLFWDGRSTDLESQARSPLFNPKEHGLASNEALVAIVEANPDYRQRFRQVLGRRTLTSDDIVKALASYERTLLAGNSPFDRYVYGGDHTAMSPAAVRGMAFFEGRGGCATCHTIGDTSALLTDQAFHPSPARLSPAVDAQLVELSQRIAALPIESARDDRGRLISGDPNVAALGRFVVTNDPKDIGLFKTPSLRNVARTAPYLHDGSMGTLEEVVEAELYQRGDMLLAPIPATVAERADLVEFLKALSSPD